MPSNMKQQRKNSLATAFRKSGRKAPGTRVGTVEDWRGDNPSAKSSGGSGKTLRDGR